MLRAQKGHFRQNGNSICTQFLLFPNGPPIPGETQFLLRGPIGPRGPREIKEDPGASGKAIKRGNGELEGERLSAQFWASCMGELQGCRSCWPERLTHAEDLGGRPKTYGNLGRLTLGLKEGLGITRWPHNLGGSGLT